MNEELDILDQLDLEIAAAVSKSALTSRKADLAKKAGNTQLSHDRRLALRRELEEVNAQLSLIQWTVVANVGLFAQSTCHSCGSVSTSFLQHMERLKTNYGAKVDRLARIEAPHAGYPNEVLIQRSETDICAGCCGEHGYDLSTGQVIDRSHKIMKELSA